MTSIHGVGNTAELRSPHPGERYAIKHDDTLGRIAKAHGLSVAQLRQANPGIATSRDLRAGAALRIPPASHQVSQTAAPGRHFSSENANSVHPNIRAQFAALPGSTPSGHLRQGDSGPEVGALRQDLQRLGYLTQDQKSDVFGARMEAAVKAFQKDVGISQTGVVGPTVRGAIRDVIESVGVNRNADASHVIRDVQSRLFQLGYLNGHPLGDEKGTYGPRTEAAVKRFQRDEGLPVSGRVGIGTFRDLNDPATGHLRQGDRGPGVAALRHDLQSMGYLSKAQKSDVFGERMEAAVKAFQRDAGITATGVAGPTTTGNLDALAGGVGIGRSHTGEAAEAIRAIQSRLFDLGYLAGHPLGSEKGDFGPRTRAAVERFQKAEGLPVSGRVGSGTFARLQEAGDTGGVDSAPAATLQGRINQAMRFFESQGWTRAQSAGLVANLQAESSLEHGRAQDSGGPGYGLAQWESPRQADFARWAGHDIHGSSFGEQLRFIQYELTHSQASAGRALRGASGAGDAGAIVSKTYERPADREGQARVRAGLASQIFASSAP